MFAVIRAGLHVLRKGHRCVEQENLGGRYIQCTVCGRTWDR